MASSSPSKGIKRDRDGMNVDGSHQLSNTKESFLNKFYVSFVNDAIEKKKEVRSVGALVFIHIHIHTLHREKAVHTKN